MVLGQANFNVGINTNIAQVTPNPQPTTMSDPVSVTSDGRRLFVADLGYNRVFIWNSIPTSNAAPADVALGQPNMKSAVANNGYSGTAATTAGVHGQRNSRPVPDFERHRRHRQPDLSGWLRSHHELPALRSFRWRQSAVHR